MNRNEKLARYRHLRAINKRQQTGALDCVSQATMLDCARRLGLARGRTLILDDPDEMTLVFDLVVHAGIGGRSRAIDRYADKVRPPPGSDDELVLTATRNARFTIWEVERRHAIAGLHVVDVATRETLWLIDESFESSCRPGYVCASRLIAVDDFVMTCRGIRAGRCNGPHGSATVHASLVVSVVTDRTDTGSAVRPEPVSCRGQYRHDREDGISGSRRAGPARTRARGLARYRHECAPIAHRPPTDHPPADWPPPTAAHRTSRATPPAASARRASVKSPKRKSRYDSAMPIAMWPMLKRLAASASASCSSASTHARILPCHSAMCGSLCLLRRPEPLAEPGERDVQHAVAQRQPAQRGQPFGPCGKQLRPVVQRVEILADHRRIVDDRAVLQHQRRNLPQRVLAHQFEMRRRPAHHRAHRLDPIRQPEFVRDDHHLAHIGRARRPVQLSSCHVLHRPSVASSAATGPEEGTR